MYELQSGVSISLGTFHAPLLTCVRFDALRQRLFDRNIVYTEPISTSLWLLSQRSPHIKQLELCGTLLHQPREDYPWLFGTTFPLLGVLRFEKTDITDDLMELGAKRMSSLKMRELSGCEGVTGPGLFSFLQMQDKTFQLVLEGCPHITEDAVEALSKATTLWFDNGRKRQHKRQIYFFSSKRDLTNDGKSLSWTWRWNYWKPTVNFRGSLEIGEWSCRFECECNIFYLL